MNTKNTSMKNPKIEHNNQPTGWCGFAKGKKSNISSFLSRELCMFWVFVAIVSDERMKN